MQTISKDQLLKYINCMIRSKFYDTSLDKYERFALPVFKMKDDIEDGVLDILDVQKYVGQWYADSDRPDRFFCSECGASFGAWKHEETRFHYCPNCGCKMEVEK